MIFVFGVQNIQRWSKLKAVKESPCGGTSHQSLPEGERGITNFFATENECPIGEVKIMRQLTVGQI